MASCTCENWTLEDLASALQNMNKDNKIIAVPMFQRGQRWNMNQRKVFIDSLIKGYPVGTMLFYETIENGQQTYILVDGLQRGNSIKMYMSNPTDFFYDSSISSDFCKSILSIVDSEFSEENCNKLRNLLTTFIKEQKTFKNLQYFEPAQRIASEFNADLLSCASKLIEVIGEFFKERQDLYDQIAMTVIPVIVYHGAEENLPEIFDRINSQGTPLDQYEVYAAAWPVKQRFKISNEKIVESAIKKYDSFIADGFTIHGYDREKMRQEKEVNAFEYLFGLSKYIVNTYDLLGFNKSLSDDTVNPLGFELVNACLNDTDRIKTLYKNIYEISDVDKFEEALYEAIKFVINSISAIAYFKGNTHSDKIKIFHSKYQILSMISTTFKEMYGSGDYTKKVDGWDDKKSLLRKNLRAYYVYDIITNYWSEGGTGKIHSAAKPNRYLQEIPPRMWKTALDGFFNNSMFRNESKQIANPRSEEYVILNCIYLNTFTAMDQLSEDSKFDVEHIATKEQMKKLIAKCGDSRLPVSCIANLCYLPEYVNRSKKDKNFYQDTKYLEKCSYTLEEIEEKFSFTEREDLEWMDMPYETSEDFEILKQFYTDFCVSRFETMKRCFCISMGIDYEAMQVDENVVLTPSNESTEETKSTLKSTRNFSASCVKRVEEFEGSTLIKVSRSAAYKTEDGSKGFVFCSSKAYKQGQREKYWYGFRKAPLDDIKDCKEQFMVYGCKNANEVLIIPASVILDNLDKINFSYEDDEVTISHWHIVFFRDAHGHMTQLLSKPELKEISINEYKI